MAPSDVQPLREILERMLVKYLTVRPKGFQLASERRLETTIQVRILGYGGARTLYRKRQPQCRSLDGVQSSAPKGKSCAECAQRSRCTPQIRLDLFVEQLPFRLLLAYTNARNFLEYCAQLKRRDTPLEEIMHRIDVVDRGSWGELRFAAIQSPSNE